MSPAIKYKSADGKPLKGVTTVLGILAKPALIGWAYKQGIAGVPLYESRDKAADAGTLAHTYVENHLKGLPDPSSDGIPKDIVEKAS